MGHHLLNLRWIGGNLPSAVWDERVGILENSEFGKLTYLNYDRYWSISDINYLDFPDSFSSLETGFGIFDRNEMDSAYTCAWEGDQGFIQNEYLCITNRLRPGQAMDRSVRYSL